MLAVELRPEERRSPLQNFVSPTKLTNLLLQLPQLPRFGRGHASHVAVVDVGLLDPRPDGLDPVSELRRDPLDRPVLSPPAPLAESAPSGPLRPSPPANTDARSTSQTPDSTPWLHPRFQGQEPPSNPGRFNFPGRFACDRYAAARRSTSFSCSSRRMRFFASRNSAWSAQVSPGRRPSSTSACLIQFDKDPSEIPKSFAICESGVWPCRATATTSSRNSFGYGFATETSFQRGRILTDQTSTKLGAIPSLR